MSEKAKAALQEKMKDSNKNMIVSFVPFGLGVILIVEGILDLWGPIFTSEFCFSIITIGIACVIIGICMAVPYVRKYNRLKKELENVAASFSNCVNCKKEIPKGNFAFCPFCGNPVKK